MRPISTIVSSASPIISITRRFLYGSFDMEVVQSIIYLFPFFSLVLFSVYNLRSPVPVSWRPLAAFSAFSIVHSANIIFVGTRRWEMGIFYCEFFTHIYRDKSIFDTRARGVWTTRCVHLIVGPWTIYDIFERIKSTAVLNLEACYQHPTHKSLANVRFTWRISVRRKWLVFFSCEPLSAAPAARRWWYE